MDKREDYTVKNTDSKTIENYRVIIIQSINKIDDMEYLKKIYSFIKVFS